MTQLVYDLNQANAVAGSLGEFDRHWVRSYVNGTSVKKRYTVSVDVAADEELTVTLTSPDGVATVVSYNEGAAGTVTTKRNGLIAAINASVARFYCRASVKDSDEFYIESNVAGQDFTAATAEANLTLTNDVAYVASPVIGFGLAVAQGAQENECKALTAVTDKVIGVALFTHADNPNNGVAGYKAQSAVSVLRRGVVVVRVEEAVSAEDPVFVRAVAAGTEKAGAFRKSVDSTDCIAMPGCKFLTAAAAGGLAFVQIDASIRSAAAVSTLAATLNLTLAAPTAAALNAVFSDVEVETALGLKADQDKVAATFAAAETRLDDLETKVNAIITALKGAGLMN
jgi:hypothetical protein